MASGYPGGSDLGLLPTAVMSAGGPYDASAYAQQQQTPPSQGHTPQDQQPPPPMSNPPYGQQQRQSSLQPAAQAPSVKRPRPVKSCTECRKRKLKCDRLCPCSQCRKSSRMCRYKPENEANNGSDGSDTEDVGTRSAKRIAVASSPTSRGPNGEVYMLARGASDGGLPPTAVPLLEELAIKMDRMEQHMMGRSAGGYGDQRKGESWRGGGGIAISSDTVCGLSIRHGGARTRFFGAASPRVLLTLFDEAREFMKDHAKDPNTREVFASFRKLHKLLRTEYQKSLTPISVFVDSMMPIRTRMLDILPKKPVCDHLVRGYLDNNETLYRVIHAPSFMSQYEQFWHGTTSEAYLPKLLGVLSIATRFESKSRGLSHERSEGIHLPTAAALMRLWLNDLRGKRLVEMETLQVELLWLLTMRMVKEHARDGWTQLGSILRMAQSMGLHRDPSELGQGRITPFNAEMRRRIWATVADLDYYVSNDANLPSLLREEDSTTAPPRNLNDVDIWPDMQQLPPSKPFDQITDNHVQAYAATTFCLRKRSAALTNRFDKIQNWSEILEVGEQLERHIYDIELIYPRRPADNIRKSRHWRCRGLLDGHVRQPLMNLYRPFVLGVPGVPLTITRAYLRHTASIIQSIDELNPKMKNYDTVCDLAHVGIRSEAVQAAMSMCYYIRSSMHPSDDAASMSVQQALRVSPPDSGSTVHGEGIIWSAGRLIDDVQRSIDFLIQNIKRGDTKDIICLSVVLESVKTPEPSRKDMTHGLRLALDQCLHAANTSLDRLRVVDAQPDPATQVAEASSYGGGLMGSSAQGYAQHPPPGNLMNSMLEEEGWVFWGGWD